MAQRTHQRRSSDRVYRQTDALLQALSRVEFQYTSGFDPEKLFGELLASLLTLTGSGYGFIGEVITGLNGVPALQPRAMANLAAAELDPAALLDVVMTAQSPVVCDLLPGDDASTRRQEIKSLWLLPIHCRGALVGVAGVADHQKGHNAELVAHLKPFLIMCGILIEALRNDQDRRQAGHALRESDERFRIMADTAPVMLWMSGPDKLCNFFNKGWLDFTGRPLETELGNGWAEGVHPEDYERCLEHYVTAFDARREFKMEYRLRRADGEYRWILDHGTPRYRSDGSFVGYIGSCIDITDRKQAELDAVRQRNELAHLSRVAMLSELSGSLAHELNQPLAAILSNAQAAQRFLARDVADLDEVRDILKDIVAQDKRAGEVIHRLRLLLKKGEVQRQPLAMNELADEVLQLIHSDLMNYGVTVSVQFAPELPLVQGDRVQLQQVLLNLIMNACSALADAETPDRRLVLRTELADDKRVRVSVADRGRGIPPQNLERIFEPFFTTRPEGMGLGLTVCRTIITAHGGRLWAANNADRGASVSFTLPAEPKDAA